jgi:predicted DsbA family dithiol-disulfide isomerase
MGKGPTGTSESTDNEPEEEEPKVHPDQTDFDEHDTLENDNPDEGETPTPPAGGGGGRGGAGGGGGPGGAPVTPGGEEGPEADEPEDEPEEASPEANELPEPPEETDQSEETDDTEDEEEDEEPEEKEAEIIVYTDPWDITGWGNEPDLRRLQETFGDKLTIEYDVLPVRTIEELKSDTEMPTVDDPDLPESTTDSHRALTAAQEQGLTREYIRRLRIAALSEGRDIESEDILVEFAAEVGLDADQLREDMANVDVEVPEPVEETPHMEVTIADIPHFWTENIEFGRIFGRMVGEGVQPKPTGRMIPQFVAEYEPVTTAEVAETFELDQDQAAEELRQRENVVSRDFGSGTFWFPI